MPNDNSSNQHPKTLTSLNSQKAKIYLQLRSNPQVFSALLTSHHVQLVLLRETLDVMPLNRIEKIQGQIEQLKSEITLMQSCDKIVKSAQ